MIYDTIIIGSGPAGLSAGIYGTRAGLNLLLIEKGFVGGQIGNTKEIENYLGFGLISGFDLITKFENHAKEQNVNIIFGEVLDINVTKRPFTIKLKDKEYVTKTIIFATGAKPKQLGIAGEIDFIGKGVSYCATCDGAFYRYKTAVVLGSGNTAIEDALFLSRICKKVYSVSRSDYFKSDKILLDQLKKLENVELIYNFQANEIKGSDSVTNIILENTKTNELLDLETNGVFVAIGINPGSNLLENKINIDDGGYVITNETMETSIKGIFAVGDARNTPLRQVVTAVADGAIATSFLSQYL